MDRQGQPSLEYDGCPRCICGLAPRADRLSLPFLLQGQHPLEEGRGCGLGLAVAALGLDRLLGHELRPGEQRLLRLRGNFSLGGHALGSRKPVGRTNPAKRAFDPTGPEVRSSHRKIGSGRAPPVAPPQQMLTDAGVTLALIIGAAPRYRQARSCRIRLDLP